MEKFFSLLKSIGFAGTKKLRDKQIGELQCYIEQKDTVSGLYILSPSRRKKKDYCQNGSINIKRGGFI